MSGATGLVHTVHICLNHIFFLRYSILLFEIIKTISDIPIGEHVYFQTQ